MVKKSTERGSKLHSFVPRLLLISPCFLSFCLGSSHTLTHSFFPSCYHGNNPLPSLSSLHPVKVSMNTTRSPDPPGTTCATFHSRAFIDQLIALLPDVVCLMNDKLMLCEALPLCWCHIIAFIRS